ncbi:hypothetical protein ACHAW6_010016 [Cyclotella cf. meneghiniana]
MHSSPVVAFTTNTLILICTLNYRSLTPIHSFTIGSSTTKQTNNNNSRYRHRRTTTAGTVSMSTPNFGDWKNDDFLNSLGSNDGDAAYVQQQPPQQMPPQNDLTDEEITEMALRAAKFYNTDTSIEEAYGIRREGPPRRQEE